MTVLRRLAVNRGLTGLGYYISVPLLAIMLATTYRVPLGLTGVYVAAFGFCSKAGGLALLAFPDLRASPKLLMYVGMLLSANGFMALSSGESGLLFLALCVSGLGISINLIGV